MRYLLLLAAAAAGYLAYQKLGGQLPGSDADTSSELECREVKLIANVDSTNSSGRGWDLNSPPDIAFQVGNKWTGVCQETLECELSLELPVPSKRIDIRVWDRDEKDQISGEEAKTELIASGGLRIDRPPARLGSAVLEARCLD